MINIALFKNDKKETDNQPDYKGWNKETGDSVAGWVKEARNGKKYISLSFKTGEENKDAGYGQKGADQNQATQTKQSESINDFDDDIPF